MLGPYMFLPGEPPIQVNPYVFDRQLTGWLSRSAWPVGDESWLLFINSNLIVHITQQQKSFLYVDKLQRMCTSLFNARSSLGTVWQRNMFNSVHCIQYVYQELSLDSALLGLATSTTYPHVRLSLPLLFHLSAGLRVHILSDHLIYVTFSNARYHTFRSCQWHFPLQSFSFSFLQLCSDCVVIFILYRFFSLWPLLEPEL